MQFPVAVGGDSVELVLQFEEVLLEAFEGLLDHFASVLMGGLHLDLHHVVQGMRHAVARELDLLVLEEVDPQEVADCVVFEGEAVGDGVDHLAALVDLDVLAGFLQLVLPTEFEAVVLTHQCKYILDR